MPAISNFEDIKRRKSATSVLRRSFVEFVFLIFLLVVAIFVFSGFSYVDLRELCFVKIKYDVLQGDRQSIIDAIKEIKKTDYILYKGLCKNVNTIYEKRCVLGKEDRPDIIFIDSDGCYIRGSKAILINPVGKNTYDIVEMRAEQIKKYSQMAIDYWNYEDSP